MKNELYPIFLKLSQLRILVVGGGNVAEEKLTFLLKSSPNAQVELVGKEVNNSVRSICEKFGIRYSVAAFNPNFLDNKQLILVATDNAELNAEIVALSKARNILVNVADTPTKCDFYLGSIVTKGPVKIAISTNGASPTLAKRLRQFLEQLLPENIGDITQQLQQYRNQITGDFQQKVKELNELTKVLIFK